MENIKESKYKKFYKLFTRGDKKVRLTVFLGIAGIALIFFSMFWGASPGDKNTAVNTPEAVKSQTTGDYVKLLEENLLYILKSIEDVGESRALITLESGVEYVYADVERTSADNAVDYDKNGESKKTNRSSSENTIVLVDGKDGKQALLRTELEPSVKGIVVVCEGGDDPLVIERVTKAVTTALGIGANRVCVTKMRQD